LRDYCIFPHTNTLFSPFYFFGFIVPFFIYLKKMIDETDNPFVRTKLREQAAHLEAKKIFK